MPCICYEIYLPCGCKPKGYKNHQKPTRRPRNPECVHPSKLSIASQEKVVEAVKRTRGDRVTAADVAAAGGLSLQEAKSGVLVLFFA